MNHEPDPFYLKSRFPAEHLEKRIERQQNHSALQFRHGVHILWENLDWIAPTLHLGLKITGLLRRGLRNAIAYTVVERDVPLARLPEEFNGLRLLHLSDLHIDGKFDHGECLYEELRGLDYDIVLMTGDYRFLTYGPIYNTMTFMRRVIGALKPDVPIYGVLGNHDALEMVPSLEHLGMRMLVNESAVIRKGEARLGIAGVDDEHFYHCADLPRALAGIADCPVGILLAHSQELIPEAERLGVDFYLCGHTHGGQICTPGGYALIKNTPYGDRFFSGPWESGAMQGYTSRGIGGSCLPARFNCPPEIIIHRLVRGGR